MQIDDLPTQMVTRTESMFKWEVAAATPSDLKTLLDSKPDGTIMFVDCQNATGNTKTQFPGALHLHTAFAMVANTIFAQLWKTDPKSLGSLLAADMVVFYCSFGQARSPAAMTSYLNLRANLKASKRPMRPQKVVLLNGGITAWQNDTGSKMKPWGFVGLKKLATVTGDEDGASYTLYTE